MSQKKIDSFKNLIKNIKSCATLSYESTQYQVECIIKWNDDKLKSILQEFLSKSK